MTQTTSLLLFSAYYYSSNRNDFCGMDDWVKHYGGIIDPHNNNIIRFSEEDYVAFKLTYGPDLRKCWYTL
jgi:hypothetical protein